jgi:hypothetical protein
VDEHLESPKVPLFDARTPLLRRGRGSSSIIGGSALLDSVQYDTGAKEMKSPATSRFSFIAGVICRVAYL